MATRKSGSSKREREAIAESTAESTADIEQQRRPSSRQANNTRRQVPDATVSRMWELYIQGFPKTRIAETLGVDRHTVARHINATYKDVAAERKISNARKLNEAVARWRRVQVQAWGYLESGENENQRSQYLRIILDAEKEIARLEGLYEGILDVDGGAVFRIQKLSQDDVMRLSDARKVISAPQVMLMDGEAHG